MSAPEPLMQRVLVADGNRINRRLLGGMLSRHGFEVQEADDGEQALTAAMTDPPELVLLDIDGPLMDGLDVCGRLKLNAETAHIPVILLSELDDAAQKMRGFRRGAADFVHKPFDRTEVLARVGLQLRQLTLTRGLAEAAVTIESQRDHLDAVERATAEVQRSMLPHSSLVERGALSWSWRFRPRRRVSGDLFGVIPLAGQKTALFVLDAAGHDEGAGLLGISIAQRMAARWRQTAPGGEPLAPAAMLRRLAFEYPVERFERTATLCCVLVDEARGLVRYSSAGHPPPLCLDPSGSARRLEAGGPPLGLGRSEDFDEGEARLGTGDRLILYSDGVLEAPDGEGRPLALEGLERVVRECRDASVSGSCSWLERRLTERCEAVAAHDDVTFVMADWAAPPGPAAA